MWGTEPFDLFIAGHATKSVETPYGARSVQERLLMVVFRQEVSRLGMTRLFVGETAAFVRINTVVKN